MNKIYDSSCIQIKEYTNDIWSQAIALAEQYDYQNIKLIERGLLACQLAGVGHDYFIDKYLRKLPIPLNQDVNTIYREQQRMTQQHNG